MGPNMDKSNLVYAKITNNEMPKQNENRRIVTLIAKMARNKYHLIIQELHDSNIVWQ